MPTKYLVNSGVFFEATVELGFFPTFYWKWRQSEGIFFSGLLLLYGRPLQWSSFLEFLGRDDPSERIFGVCNYWMWNGED